MSKFPYSFRSEMKLVPKTNVVTKKIVNERVFSIYVTKKGEIQKSKLDFSTFETQDIPPKDDNVIINDNVTSPQKFILKKELSPKKKFETQTYTIEPEKQNNSMCIETQTENDPLESDPESVGFVEEEDNCSEEEEICINPIEEKEKQKSKVIIHSKNALSYLINTKEKPIENAKEEKILNKTMQRPTFPGKRVQSPRRTLRFESNDNKLADFPKEQSTKMNSTKPNVSFVEQPKEHFSNAQRFDTGFLESLIVQDKPEIQELSSVSDHTLDDILNSSDDSQTEIVTSVNQPMSTIANNDDSISLSEFIATEDKIKHENKKKMGLTFIPLGKKVIPPKKEEIEKCIPNFSKMMIIIRKYLKSSESIRLASLEMSKMNHEHFIALIQQDSLVGIYTLNEKYQQINRIWGLSPLTLSFSQIKNPAAFILQTKTPQRIKTQVFNQETDLVYI